MYFQEINLAKLLILTCSCLVGRHRSASYWDYCRCWILQGRSYWYRPGSLLCVQSHTQRLPQTWILRKKNCKTLKNVKFLIILQAILSPALWQVKSIALSTIWSVTLRPGRSSSLRQYCDTSRKLCKHTQAAPTWILKLQGY